MICAHAAAARNSRTATGQLRKQVFDGRRATALRHYYEEELYMMELADIRNQLDKTAEKLADFRGSL